MQQRCNKLGKGDQAGKVDNFDSGHLHKKKEKHKSFGRKEQQENVKTQSPGAEQCPTSFIRRIRTTQKSPAHQEWNAAGQRPFKPRAAFEYTARLNRHTSNRWTKPNWRPPRFKSRVRFRQLNQPHDRLGIKTSELQAMDKSGNIAQSHRPTGNGSQELTTRRHQHSPVNVNDYSTKDRSKESSERDKPAPVKRAQERKRNYNQQRPTDIAVPPDGARVGAQSDKSAAPPRVDNYDRRKRRDQAINQHIQHESPIDAHAHSDESNEVTASIVPQSKSDVDNPSIHPS